MKKLLAILLAALMLLSMTACAGGNNKQAIIGTWKLVDQETQTEYGLGLQFTKDGKLHYGLTEDVLKALADGGDAQDALAGLDLLMSIEYKIKSDTEMEVTVKAMFGLAKESTTVTYSLQGDTLEFDGAAYTRVK